MKKAILLVDDNQEILKSLKLQIKSHFGNGYIYEMSESAEEALALIDELHQNNIEIILIVTDWLMPGIRGDDFLIKVYEKYPQIKGILITGQAEQEAIDRAKAEANLKYCLYKPWSKQELITLINKVIHHEK